MKRLYKLSLLLLTLLLPATALSYDFEEDGLFFSIDYTSGRYTVFVTYENDGYNSYSGDIEIPSSVYYDGISYEVTAIGPHAFAGCSEMTSVTIPYSINEIDFWAFDGCSNLNSIIVDSYNSKYDSRDNCNALIETASNTLIKGCKNTTIPNSITVIDYCAFEGCTGLTSLTIPNSVISIGQAFIGCTGLTSIIVDSGNQRYDSRNNCNAIIETATNNMIVGCCNTVIPNSVTSIGSEAFSGCSGLTSVTIANSEKVHPILW